MRDGDFLDSGRRSTDTVQYLRKIERELGQAETDVVTWKSSYRDEAMKSANLQHQLNAAKKLIALLIEPADPKQFYEIKRGQK